jgi:VIT1/CCC1 family predicted Fe2+/Mn2+ transporter
MSEHTTSNIEPHDTGTNSKLNWLRAAVLGSNDGIVSVASIVVGVAGAISDARPILIAGIAGLIAGALSMAMGEYVSVSSQRDTEQALLEKERYELEHDAENELQELASMYEKKGLSKETANVVAKELTAHDAFAAHVDIELNIDPNDLTNPWHAAVASALSFLAGGIIPLLAIVLPPADVRIPVTFASVLVALVITGVLSARASGSALFKPTMRIVVGGTLAMLVTYGIGKLFGVVGL